MKQVTYEEAKTQGLKRYFTGEPCKKYLHVEERLTSSRECMGCKRTREQAKYDSDPSTKGHYYTQNRERLLQQQRKCDAARRTEKLAYGRKWRFTHGEYAKAYRKQNAGLYAWHAASRRAKVRRATPPWSQSISIKGLYLEAHEREVETGIPHDVDHIIPLVNRLVCGLHVFENLQVLESDANRAKKNTFLLPQ